MAYSTVDRSQRQGAPYELFEFVVNNDVYRYTNSATERMLDGETFDPTQIRLDTIEVGSLMNSSRLVNITAVYTLPFYVDYAYLPFPDLITVTVWRGHDGEEEHETIWSGIVTSFGMSDDQAVIGTGSVLQTLLNVNVNRVRVQTLCNHRLYDDRCGVDPEAHRLSSSIAQIINNNLRLNSSLTPNEFRGGTCTLTATGERRLITANSGNIITLSLQFRSPQPSQGVILQKGCDHLFNGDCQNKFNNQLRYGGFIYMPQRITDERVD